MRMYRIAETGIVAQTDKLLFLTRCQLLGDSDDEEVIFRGELAIRA